MVWCLFDRDLYGEKVEALEHTIEEQARRLEEQEARLRSEQERRSMLGALLLERFPERAGQLEPVLEHLLRLSSSLAIRTVLQQSWDALCRNASLEVVQGA